MTKLLKALFILGLAAVLALPVSAGRDDYDRDDFDDLDDDVVLAPDQRLTREQKYALEQAEDAAELAAKIAEREAKAAAVAAERAARRAPKPVREAIKAEGKYNREVAKLAEEQGVLDSLAALADQLGTDLSTLPTVAEILVDREASATEAAAFFRSLIPMTVAERSAALAERRLAAELERQEFLAGLDGLDELQLLVVEATAEYAEELGDVAEAYADWQDKLALSQLSPADYSAEMSRRSAEDRARKAELRALPRSSQVWLRKAWEAEEDAAEASLALDRLAQS